jgi:hypothetical protein
MTVGLFSRMEPCFAAVRSAPRVSSLVKPCYHRDDRLPGDAHRPELRRATAASPLPWSATGVAEQRGESERPHARRRSCARSAARRGRVAPEHGLVGLDEIDTSARPAPARRRGDARRPSPTKGASDRRRARAARTALMEGQALVAQVSNPSLHVWPRRPPNVALVDYGTSRYRAGWRSRSSGNRLPALGYRRRARALRRRCL